MNVSLSENKNVIVINDATELERLQLELCFKARIKNWYVNPLVKAKKWDGYIKYITRGRYVSAGLWKVLLDMCKQYNFEINKGFLKELINTDVSLEEIDAFVREFIENNPKFDIRPYQVEAIYMFIKYDRIISEISTSAGKTFMIYMVFQYLKRKFHEEGKPFKFLLVVPITDLIIQTQAEWMDLDKNLGRKTFSALLVSGETKHKGADLQEYDVIIGTYQSLLNKDQEFFDAFTCLFVDESQYAKAKSLITIGQRCSHINIRKGTSGTTKIKGVDADSFTIQDNIGPLLYTVKPDYLIQNEYATPVKIIRFVLSYLDNENRIAIEKLAKRKSFDKAKLLSLENDFVINSNKRLNFILSVLKKTTRNSLILFKSIEKGYGQKIYHKLREVPGKEVFYVDGGTSTADRKFFKAEMEKSDNRLLVASFGTFSTGISIKNIHNIFLVESYKSETIIKQSTGRGMRLLEGKDHVNIIDFIDDFRVLNEDKECKVLKKGAKKNYLYKHGEERHTIFNSEGYPIKTYKKTL